MIWVEELSGLSVAVVVVGKVVVMRKRKFAVPPVKGVMVWGFIDFVDR